MAVIWAAAMVALIVLEALTVNLVSIWFAAGSLAAMAASMLGAAVWVQITVFFAVSCAVLLFLRPLARRLLPNGVKPTNADRVIGMEGIVTERIDNLCATGTVSVDGKSWTARSEDGSVIPVGEPVIPRRIEGVKLMVSRARETADKN